MAGHANQHIQTSKFFKASEAFTVDINSMTLSDLIGHLQALGEVYVSVVLPAAQHHSFAVGVSFWKEGIVVKLCSSCALHSCQGSLGWAMLFGPPVSDVADAI